MCRRWWRAARRQAHLWRSETLLLRLLVLVLVCVQTFQIYLGYTFVSRCADAARCRLLMSCSVAFWIVGVQYVVRRHGRVSVLRRRSYEHGELFEFSPRKKIRLFYLRFSATNCAHRSECSPCFRLWALATSAQPFRAPKAGCSATLHPSARINLSSSLSMHLSRHLYGARCIMVRSVSLA